MTTCVCVCVCVCVCKYVNFLIHLHLFAFPQTFGQKQTTQKGKSTGRAHDTKRSCSTFVVAVFLLCLLVLLFPYVVGTSVLSCCGCCLSPSTLVRLFSNVVGAAVLLCCWCCSVLLHAATAGILHPPFCFTAFPLWSWHTQTWPQTSCEPRQDHRQDAAPEPRHTSEPSGNHDSGLLLREPGTGNTLNGVS